MGFAGYNNHEDANNKAEHKCYAEPGITGVMVRIFLSGGDYWTNERTNPCKLVQAKEVSNVFMNGSRKVQTTEVENVASVKGSSRMLPMRMPYILSPVTIFSVFILPSDGERSEV